MQKSYLSWNDYVVGQNYIILRRIIYLEVLTKWQCSENVMVTGWNWVLLTDIVSFKPAILPEDNPADFNFYTSRHCSCYIAPERFLDSRQAD